MYALITGASSGIGREMAKILAFKGYHLILVARRMDRLKQLQKEIEGDYPISVIPLPYDLSKKENCIALFEECKQYPISVVINNAGFGKTGRFVTIPLEEELDMIATNVTALHILTKLFATHMKRGYILNVSSIAGHTPTPVMATYGATKAYVLSLTESINYEMKRFNKPVHISALCPGPVTTEFNQVSGADFACRSITAKQCATLGLKGMFAKKSVIFPSVETKLLAWGAKLSPMKLILPIEYIIQTKKLEKDKLL